MIKAVIFDFGGVILRTPDRSSRLSWEKKLNLAEWQSEKLVFESEMGRKAQLGQISEEALWQWVGEELNLPPEELAAFRHDFWAGDVLDQQLVAYIRSLRPRYQVAMISNAMDGLRQVLTDVYPIADAFDLIVVSAEAQIMKPDPAIYHLTLERLGRQPGEAVFIDDFAHNVAGARQVGMHAIHFQPGIDLTAELAQLGVE